MMIEDYIMIIVYINFTILQYYNNTHIMYDICILVLSFVFYFCCVFLIKTFYE